MFRSLGLFQGIKCPNLDSCDLPNCFFFHQPTNTIRAPAKASGNGTKAVAKGIDVQDVQRAGKRQKIEKERSLNDTSEMSEQQTIFQGEQSLVDLRNSRHDPIATRLSQLPPLKAKILPSVVISPVDSRYKARSDSQAQSESSTPVLVYNPTCTVPHESRKLFLNLFHEQFIRIYKSGSSPLPSVLTLSKQHAIDQEASILKSSNNQTYKNAAKTALIALKKRPLSTSIDDIGIYPAYKSPTSIDILSELVKLVHPVSTLSKWGYNVTIPVADGHTRCNEEGDDRICDRCGTRFVVSADEQRWMKCHYHHGRRNPGRVSGLGQGERNTARSWTCCEGSEPCTVCKTHVFKIEFSGRLASYSPFRMLTPQDEEGFGSPRRDEADVKTGGEVRRGKWRRAVGVDCEMVYTTAGLELARVSVTELIGGETVLDEFIHPKHKILDYNTRFSGITKESLSSSPSPGQRTPHDTKQTQRTKKSKKLTIDDIPDLLAYAGITRETILIGHGLENDMNAMHLIHTSIIDSAILFPHPRGRPYRLPLKMLVRRYLGREIQVGANGGSGGLVGHDALEDARGAVDLVLWRVKNGDKKVGDVPFAGKLR